MTWRNSVENALTGEFATIAVIIKTLYINFFYQHDRFVNKIHKDEGFAHLFSEHLFITEHTEWVSFIIITQSFHELISRVHNPRCLHECWKCSCTWKRDEEKWRCPLKFKCLDIHLIRGNSYYN